MNIGGSARVRRLIKEPHKDWACACKVREPSSLAFTYRIKPASLKRCGECGARRP